MNSNEIMKLLFLTIGTIGIGSLFCCSLYFFYKKMQLKKYTATTSGKVISNVRRTEHTSNKRRNNHIVKWYSLCQYYVGDTQCVRETTIGTFNPREVGTNVIVHYNPDNCHEAYIEGDDNSMAKSLVALIIGIFASIFLFFIIKSI